MSDKAASDHAARPRAVADLPLAELSARRSELARQWAIELIMRRPLDQLGAVPLEEIVAHGPALLDAVLAAVASDAGLAHLTAAAAAGLPSAPAGADETVAPAAAAARLAGICGAADAAATAEAVESLRGVLARALAQELVLAAPPELTAAIDRLAHVCAAALATALREGRSSAQPAAGRPDAFPETAPPGPAAPGPAPMQAAAGPVPPSRLRENSRPTLVDERPDPAQAATQPAAPEQRPEPEQPPAPKQPQAPGALADATGEIAIRDERGEGPGAWIGTISRQLERHARDARPFAVLLVELAELERMRSQEGPGEAERLDAELERTLAVELAGARDAAAALVRPPVTEALAAGAPSAISLTRERPGRYWMVSPANDRAGARRLSERITAALSEWRSSAGAPLSVLVGAAACPEDGVEAAALAAYADVDLYAARSAARAGYR